LLRMFGPLFKRPYLFEKKTKEKKRKDESIKKKNTQRHSTRSNRGLLREDPRNRATKRTKKNKEKSRF